MSIAADNRHRQRSKHDVGGATLQEELDRGAFALGLLGLGLVGEIHGVRDGARHPSNVSVISLAVPSRKTSRHGPVSESLSVWFGVPALIIGLVFVTQ